MGFTQWLASHLEAFRMSVSDTGYIGVGCEEVRVITVLRIMINYDRCGEDQARRGKKVAK